MRLRKRRQDVVQGDNSSGAKWLQFGNDQVTSAARFAQFRIVFSSLDRIASNTGFLA